VGFSVGLEKWRDLDVGLVAEIRAFATAHGSHDEDVLDDAWWKSAFSAEPVRSRHELADRYGTAAAYALEDVLDTSLKLASWRTTHPGIRTEWLLFPPFTFVDSYDGHPAFWTRVTSDSLALVLGDPTILLDQWRGAYDTPQSRAYRDAGRLAFDNLAHCTVGDDDDRAVRGIEYAMFHLLREAWAQRLPVVVRW
jgi:hypothetical protein